MGCDLGRQRAAVRSRKTFRFVLTLPALKVQQFSLQFYLLNLAAADVERLVRFEVLGEAGVHGKKSGRRSTSKASPVNWEQIERKVQTDEKAYQRPILRKKVDDLAQHYLQCRDAGAVPAIPGAVLLTADAPLDFVPEGNNPFVGVLRFNDEDDTLRVLDGQHRLLALAALLHSEHVSEDDRAAARTLQVPAVFFAGLPSPSVVEMFVTINSKHTKLNPSLLFSLKGRQLYADPIDARIHDTIRHLNEASSSSLKDQIKMLGVGKGKVTQSALAQDFKRTLAALQSTHGASTWFQDFVDHLPRFYLAYFKEIAKAFEVSWSSKKHSIQSPAALRAFIQATESVVPIVMARGGDPRVTLGELVGRWRAKLGDEFFETAGPWKELVQAGSRGLTRTVARRLAELLEEST